jgi:hypothetical protein
MAATEIDSNLAARLDSIAEQFIECRKAILQQSAETSAVAKLLFQLLPPLAAAFDALLKEEQAKNVEPLRQLDAQLQALRQGASRQPATRPN